MDLWKHSSSSGAALNSEPPLHFSKMVVEKAQFEQQERFTGQVVKKDVHVDFREIYFLIMHFLSSGPCQRTFGQLCDELLEHELLPRRYHAWYSRSGASSGNDSDDGISLPLGYNNLAERYSHIEKDHLVKLLKQLLLQVASPAQGKVGGKPNAADVPTLTGSGSFSLLDCDKSTSKQVKPLPEHLRWPHLQSHQVHGLSLREIGGGFSKHHRAPSIRSACYAIAKPTTMVPDMKKMKKTRGHRNAVYCAIFDRSGRYVITGSDDRLVKIWSMETAFCLASCRGHEGDITDLAVNLNNALVASASNDFVIRVWRLPDGVPISVLRGHTGAVTAIAFSPRPSAQFQLLSSSDDGTCRIWDARYSQCSPRIYVPKPSDAVTGRSSGPSSIGPSSSNIQSNQILCCAYNATGTVFVTGSSDTYARVWSACRSSTEESEQPIHEMDVLAGHENDVNYVQFSGCAVTSRSSMFETLKEESVPKFKNSWYSHDNIVTCSRDGSAIIWAPKSRRSHGKSVRWTKSYHLKVPPPPLPPQPPRGGPRQRILPTPRGVNMIVWSLDNRFVLAAIMDCRICVWNAGDGSLVHSLTGHTESSYVLDVHPFNPRIAMSAGYDGKAIIWDIWEGIPVRTFAVGPFKLVDGKFSQDGTSIVLSDDVGQIYLLNTGQGESYKDAKYDQFFLGDYRPLVQDAAGNVIDQETQLVPYRRNMQDLICDSSMIPYPEPYQTMFQQRRLGALGREWHPSSIKFAVGPDFSLGLDFIMPPMEDLDRMMIEPLPEIPDAIYWEPENEVISDDGDSEYNVAEECPSDGEQGGLCYSSSSDPGCSEESDVEHSQKDSLRNSRRRKHKTQVELLTSGRRVMKRNLDEHDSSISGSNVAKKLKGGRKVSNRKSAKAKSSRPQRVAARNAINMFSKITGISTDEDNEDDSEDDMFSSDSELHDSTSQRSISDRYMQNLIEKSPKEKQLATVDDLDTAKPSELSETLPGVANRKKLVFKISLRDSKKHFSSEGSRLNGEIQGAILGPSCIPPQEARVHLSSEDSGSFSRNVSADDITGQRHPKEVEDPTEDSAAENQNKIKWGEVKIRISKHSRFGDVMSGDASNEPGSSFDTQEDNGNDCNRDDKQLGTDALPDHDISKIEEFCLPDTLHRSSFESSELYDLQSNYGAPAASHIVTLGGAEKHWSEPDKSKNSDVLERREASSAGHPEQLKGNPPPKLTRLKIKTKGFSRDPKNFSKLKITKGVDDLDNDGGDVKSQEPSYLGTHEKNEDSDRSISGYDDQGKEKTKKAGADIESNYDVIEENNSNAVDYRASGIGFSEAATDVIRRTRSMKMKATSLAPSSMMHNFRVKRGHEAVGTSKNFSDEVQFEERMSSSKVVVRSKSSGNKQGGHYDNDHRFLSLKKSKHPVRKLLWLTLSEHEEAYRYIPQKGDEVVYLRQGHQEFINKILTREKGPWISIKGKLRAVELCKVENLDYATLPGSGESCCKITLRFIDPSSNAFGKAFKLTLPELINFPDFIIEKTRYDDAISKNWTSGDKCVVWWRNENGEDGRWWQGTIESSQAKSDEFPDSPWERYNVQYGTDQEEIQLHSPWELHDPGIRWKHPHIDSEIRYELLSYFAKLERSVNKQDYYGIQKLNEASQKLDFLNRFPVPLYPELIQARLENNYYRSFEAVKHDIHVMMENAKEYFAKSGGLVRKVERLSDWYTRKLSALEADR